MARAKHSFSRILLTPIALLVGLAFALAALLGTLYGERATHYLVQQLVAKSTDALHSHLQRFLEKPHLVVSVNADAMRFGEITAQGLFKQPEDWFLRQHQRFPEIDDVYFGRTDGAIVGIDHTDRQLVLKITTAFPRREFYALDVHGRRWGMVAAGDYDATQRDWYRAAVAADKPIWSTVYPLQNKPSLGITAARTAYDPQGQRVGVMGVNLTLESISEHLRSHPVAVRSVSYIVDAQGLLVASSSAGTTLVDRSVKPPARMAAASSADGLVASSFKAMAAGGQRDALEMTLDQERWWVYVTRYQDKLGLDWRLVSVVDPTPFLDGVRQVAQLTLVLGGVLLLALTLLVKRVTRGLARPLERLASATDRVAEGHYGESLPSPGGGRELDRLVGAFNHMSQQLLQAHQQLARHADELEQQVLQRTDELQRSNDALRHARAQADAASQAKTRFLATLSHEIRAPLGTITGLTHLMRDEHDPTQQDARLALIADAGHHLLNVVNGQLELSKIEAGRLDIERQPLDVAALVARVLGWMAEPARAKGLRLSQDVPALPPLLLGDATRLQQALLNYLANALHWTAQGEVQVQVRVEAEEADALLLRFTVSDTGPGIAPARLRQLFTPFERAGADAADAPAGTGLGLSITRALAQAMGGDAGADSTPGQGSRFHFTVRLGRPGTAPTADATPATAAAGVQYDATAATAVAHAAGITRAALGAHAAALRVLVVDDDPVAQMITGAMLGRIGLPVATATSGAEALRLAATTDLALVLMDLELPDLPGLEVARRLRQVGALQGVPIIAVSANAFVEDRQRCLNAGLDDFLAKPLEPDAFFALVRRWLAPEADGDHPARQAGDAAIAAAGGAPATPPTA